MKIRLHLKTILYCGLFAFLVLIQTSSIFAQQDPCSGLGAARLIKKNEQVKINFFKADANGTAVGDALSTEQIEVGFKEGDAVAINVSAPYCFYTYVVNVSEWDGITLQYPSDASENVGTKAGGEKKLGFALENTSKTKATTGREELLVLVTKNKIESLDLQTVLNNTGQIKLNEAQSKEGQDLLKSSLAEGEPTIPPSANTSQKPKNKFIKVVSVGCKIASIFFPFAKIACAASGFGAAKLIRAQGNAIAVAPTTDTKQLVFRFSFPVQPKQP